ncbi:MAG: hypothetical protein RL011_497, partial [Pseudomonadota bacterium]
MAKKQVKKVTKKVAAEDDTSAEVISRVRKSAKQITTSSTAEYFAKNLQQVGFSS